jgi:peptide/nickel transport system permease protein
MAMPALEVSGLETGAPPIGGAPTRVGSRKRFLANLSVVASIAFLVVVLLMAVFAPAITKLSGWGPFTFDPTAIDSASGGLPKGGHGGISSRHWFGVEPQSGRDIFARIVYGARISMLIALSATLVTGVLGICLGMLAGYYRGLTDQVVSRVMDFLMAFPTLIFMIALLSALPRVNRPLMLITVLSLFGWTHMGRIIRGQTMALAQREFVEAAQASGAGRLTIMFKEILPNLSGTIIVIATLAVPTYIGIEAGLSFLGVGITPPAPSWGQMIASSVAWFTVVPSYFLIPGLFLFLTVVSFTVIGDRIQRLLSRSGGF